MNNILYGFCMKIGVLSDTHDHIENLQKCMEIFRDQKVEKIIHLGDYCAGPLVRAMKDAPVPVMGIRGNNDGDIGRLYSNFEFAGGEFWHDDCRTLELAGAQIACYHGTVPAITEALINCGTYDIVLCGHTHEVDHRTVGNTLVLNPGSVHGFDEKATCAILDTESREVEIFEIDN